MKEYLPKLNMFERILSAVLKRYTYKIYSKGFKDGFNCKYWYYYKISV